MSKIPSAIGPYVVYRKAGDLTFVSGQIPLNGETGEVEATTFRGQLEQVMQNIGYILAELDATFDQIVKTTILLKDMENFAELNEVYGSYFGEAVPARSAFEVARLPKDVLVEIEFIVYHG